MNLLPIARQKIIQVLWENYLTSVPLAKNIVTFLQKQTHQKCILDHLAIIDLPSTHSGIPFLSQLFSQIGFNLAGKGYLPDKQNDFAWLTDCDAKGQQATEALPQIVIADYRLHELPSNVRKIIEKYIQHIPNYSLSELNTLCERMVQGNTIAQENAVSQIQQICSGRAWPTPTLSDYETVKEANELLAWTLVFGRQPNHFGISIHYMTQFNHLNDFNNYLKQEIGISFNQRAQEIKGDASMGITQSSTADDIITVKLADATIDIPSPFMEFVWRYPVANKTKPIFWEDYFTGFYAQNANNVIESVYE